MSKLNLKTTVNISKAKTMFDLRHALVMAGGVDSGRIGQSVMDKINIVMEGKNNTYRIVESNYVAVKDSKGLTVYSFTFPVEIIK